MNSPHWALTEPKRREGLWYIYLGTDPKPSTHGYIKLYEGTFGPTPFTGAIVFPSEKAAQQYLDDAYGKSTLLEIVQI